MMTQCIICREGIAVRESSCLLQADTGRLTIATVQCPPVRSDLTDDSWAASGGKIGSKPPAKVGGKPLETLYT